MTSSAIIVGCDHPGCVNALITKHHDGRRARDDARKAGWSSLLVKHPTSPGSSRLVDYCPDHGAEHAHEGAVVAAEVL